MVQWLRVFPILTEDQSSVPSPEVTHAQLAYTHTSIYLSGQGVGAFAFKLRIDVPDVGLGLVTLSQSNFFKEKVLFPSK